MSYIADISDFITTTITFFLINRCFLYYLLFVGLFNLIFASYTFFVDIFGSFIGYGFSGRYPCSHLRMALVSSRPYTRCTFGSSHRRY